MTLWEPNEQNIAAAATALKDGLLVGMPTETVYGIAANALNESAVRATFALKRRPSENPLILHVSSLEQVEQIVADFGVEAQRLAEAFWPGALTLVLPRGRLVPPAVTGGRETVAVRMPSHPIARALIQAARTPLSAPSANVFMGLSPTRAEDISAEIAEGLAGILDGGISDLGLESTVVALSENRWRVLRPGPIGLEQIQTVVPRVEASPVLSVPSGDPRLAPGLYTRHYAPQTPVRIVDRLVESDFGLTFGVAHHGGQISLPNDPFGYAALFYAALHELDRLTPAEIVIEAPPRTPEWTAVWDRLTKAATKA